MGAADATHLAAPIRYAKDENDVLLRENSRQSNSSNVFGSGISYREFIMQALIRNTFGRGNSWDMLQ